MIRLRTAFERKLEVDRALRMRACLRLDIQHPSRSCRHNSAPPPPNPAEAYRRWRGKRSEPVRLGVHNHHTRSLCAQSPAQSEQRCCWFGRRRNIFWIGRSRSPIRACSAMPLDGQTSAQNPCGRSRQHEARAAYPPCRSSNASGLWRLVSAKPTRVITRSQIHSSRTDS